MYSSGFYSYPIRFLFRVAMLSLYGFLALGVLVPVTGTTVTGSGRFNLRDGNEEIGGTCKAPRTASGNETTVTRNGHRSKRSCPWYKMFKSMKKIMNIKKTSGVFRKAFTYEKLDEFHSPYKYHFDAAKAEPDQEKEFLDNINKQRENAASSALACDFDEKRVRMLSKEFSVPNNTEGGVLYWAFRDLRIQDNWALIYAQRIALEHMLPLHIIYFRDQRFSMVSTLRHYKFIIEGLKEFQEEAAKLNIHFHFVVEGYASQDIPRFCRMYRIGALVFDFLPLRKHMWWTSQIAKRIGDEIPVYQVDAHNAVPTWVASRKQVFYAKSLRRNIIPLLPEFMTEYPPVVLHPHSGALAARRVDWRRVGEMCELVENVKPVPGMKAGYKAGMAELRRFLNETLPVYYEQRSNPLNDVTNKLSPWLHFGYISAQRCALEAAKMYDKYKESVSSFIEDVIVRRGLAENYCYRNPDYSTYDGAPEWARQTIWKHRNDKHQYIYNRRILEAAETHDPLWNSIQIQLKEEGQLHQFLRSYWAKHIMLWTFPIQRSLGYAIYLNTKYNMDGRDPMTYVGVLREMCGVHDYSWFERNILGKVRYIELKDCKRRFDVKAYIAKYGGKEYPFTRKTTFRQNRGLAEIKNSPEIINTTILSTIVNITPVTQLT